MTWQIVNQLLQPEPDWWQIQKRQEIKDGSVNERNLYPWPDRRHSYIDTHDPVIYTYRNPIEAYLSYLSRVGLSDDDEDCLEQIVEHDVVITSLEKDERNGRKVLWLRYEDYYDRDRARIEVIMKFLHKKAKEDYIRNLLEYVSIETNLRRSTDVPMMALHQSFGKWFHPVHGIQAGHVNETIKGRPGIHHSMNQALCDGIIHGETAQFKTLAALTKRLGYYSS